MRKKSRIIVLVMIIVSIMFSSLPVMAGQASLAYSPKSYDFGTMSQGSTDSTTFSIWNGGCYCEALTYNLHETCDWISVHPQSGSTRYGYADKDIITVTITALGLSLGYHQCNISIYSNRGNKVFTVSVTVVENTSILPHFTNVSCSLPIIPEGTADNDILCLDNSNCIEASNISVNIIDPIVSATINLTALGWSSTVPLINIPGTDTWCVLVNATVGTAIHDGTGYIPHQLVITAINEHGKQNTTTVTVTVWKNGDVNCDGVVTLYDATYIAKSYFNTLGFEYLPENVADVSGDCQITLYDATYLAKWYFNQPGFEVLQ